ncbi:MAG: hypothetical protein AB1942_15160 [Pseudomonadota bacterium]
MTDHLPDRSGWLNEPLASYPVEPPLPAFTDFEQRALEDLAAAFGPQAGTFREQLAAARVVDRVNTKVGFYTRVVVDRFRCRPLHIRAKGGHFEVEGLSLGMGLVLWEHDGYLATIEGYTYDDLPLEGVELASLGYRGLVQLG